MYPPSTTASTLPLHDALPIWLDLSRAIAAVQAINSQEDSDLRSDGTSAAYNAYLTSRTAAQRADALAQIAIGLDKSDLFRPALQDRKSTRLNSSHVKISYAVF